MIRISSQMLISAPKDRVSRYLRDLRHLPEYDKKVAEVVVNRQDADGAEIAVHGAFLGRKWKDTATVQFTKDGVYECSFALGRLTRMTAVYHLRPVTGGTLLGHEEAYDASVLLKPVPAARAGSPGARARCRSSKALHMDRQIKLKEIKESRLINDFQLEPVGVRCHLGRVHGLEHRCPRGRSRALWA